MPQEQSPEVEAAATGGNKKLIVIGAIALIAIVGGGLAAFFLSQPESGDAEAGDSVAKVTSSGPPIYQSLHPALVVNLTDEYGESHYMQISMDVMSREQATVNAVREHTPAIRNALILLYGNADFESIQTREGKERMLAEGRDEIARIVAELSGRDGIEAVYFTSLIIQ